MLKKILAISTLLASVFLCGRVVAQDSLHLRKNRAIRFRTLELEAQLATKEMFCMGSSNYLMEVGKHSFLKSYFFGEYNFSKKEYFYTLSADPKIYGPLHFTSSIENDLFGAESKGYHVQTGVKFYVEDYKPFSRWFCIASIGMNYSMLGTAEHKLGKTEMSYNLLTNPIKITKNLFLVVQSFGRVRHGYDFHFLQLGIESRKLPHSVFMVGTGQIQRGKQEISLGLQIPFVENHKEFKL